MASVTINKIEYNVPTKIKQWKGRRVSKVYDNKADFFISGMNKANWSDYLSSFDELIEFCMYALTATERHVVRKGRMLIEMGNYSGKNELKVGDYSAHMFGGYGTLPKTEFEITEKMIEKFKKRDIYDYVKVPEIESLPRKSRKAVLAEQYKRRKLERLIARGGVGRR